MAIPGPEGIIHSSYKPSDGKPILLDHDAPTPSGHQRLTWNQTGPEGPPGEDGTSYDPTVIYSYAFEFQGEVPEGQYTIIRLLPEVPAGGYVCIAGGFDTPMIAGPEAYRVLYSRPERITTDPETYSWVTELRVTPETNGYQFTGWAVFIKGTAKQNQPL
jgi:hypothetical protein